MPKLFVENIFVFDDDPSLNFAFLNPLDRALFPENQVKIINRHGEHVFDKGFYKLIPPGSVGLNRPQQKKYRLKKRHWYQVLPHIPNSRPVPITTVFNNKFKYRERVGGLNEMFDQIFSNVLLSRLYPKAFTDLTGVSKSGGFILYGPPGTGKTLIAKTLADILEVPTKIVSGPELFNWLLGESEAKVRALFEQAHIDQEKYGLKSPLHLIVFDEIDVMCKQKSTENPAEHSSVHNSITTQLLSEIDGMRYLNNILVIGTTNSINAIDPALYRPGRLDLLIEVPLPNANGRSEIFDIHTRTLLKNSLLADDVNIEHLIRQTHGMNGAYIEKLVRRAIDSAMKRDVQLHGTIDISDQDAEELQVKNIDFTVALTQLQTEVEQHTAF